MTREEAIEILKADSCVDCGVGAQSPCTCTFDGHCDIRDAMKMAIEALEQNEDFQNYLDKANHTNSQLIQLIEKHKMNRDTSDDCVSRAEVLKQMKEWRDCEFVKMTNPYHYLEKRIQSMPPVTPTQCIATVQFSKEDLREICNERIEIECTHGTCKDCKNNYKTSRNTFACSNGHRFVLREPSTFYCADFEKRGTGR